MKFRGSTADTGTCRIYRLHSPTITRRQKKNKTPLTDRSARVWVPIAVKIEPRNDCTRDLLHCDPNNILHQHYTSRSQNSENASSICLHIFHPSTSYLPVRQSYSLSKRLFIIDPTATAILIEGLPYYLIFFPSHRTNLFLSLVAYVQQCCDISVTTLDVNTTPNSAHVLTMKKL